MWDRQRQIQEEGGLSSLADPLQGLAHDHVVRVLIPLRCPAPVEATVDPLHPLDLVAQENPIEAAPKEFGVIVVSVDLIQVAEEGVEALLQRMALQSHLT